MSREVNLTFRPTFTCKALSNSQAVAEKPSKKWWLQILVCESPETKILVQVLHLGDARNIKKDVGKM